MPCDPGFKTIIQIALVCRDVEATSKRWATLLGVDAPKIITIAPGSQHNGIYRGKPTDGYCKLAFFQTGTCTLELIEPVDGPSSWKDALDKNGESVHHIAFKVADLNGTVKEMQSLGMPVIHQGRFGSNDGTFAYLDSEKQLGVIVELLNWDKDKP